MAGLKGSESVKCSRNVVVVPDKSLADSLSIEYDLVVLPGGLDGSNAFAADRQVGELLKAQEQAGRLIGVICAAPIALKFHGIALGKSLTSHPSKADEMRTGGYKYSEERVVEDGLLVTSRGPGTAFEFALALVKKLLGQEKVDQISAPMIMK